MYIATAKCESTGDKITHRIYNTEAILFFVTFFFFLMLLIVFVFLLR